jgi:diaminopimelate decarboxylase
MHHFDYKNGELYCEDVPVTEIAAVVGTPLYIYSRATVTRHFRVFDAAFEQVPHLICYSVKANSNIAIINIFVKEGGGADVTSGGELYRAVRAGTEPSRIVYSGVGKTREEMQFALNEDILMFNVESEQELETLNAVASKAGKKARIALRVNPDVDPKTHPYISTGLKSNKFGISFRKAVEVYQKASGLSNIDVIGIDCHIGSQLTEVTPFVDSLKRIRELIFELKKLDVNLKYLDVGGGLGIKYDREEAPPPSDYAQALIKECRDLDVTLVMEPGRVLVGNAGILVSRVLYTKENEGKNFIIVDAAMNDLARPSLYGSYQAIWPVKKTDGGTINADVVGPICETTDFLARDRELPNLKSGNLIAVMSSGAYGFSMSSTYNSRPRVAEVLVEDANYHVIRERESHEDLIRGETIPEG